MNYVFQFNVVWEHLPELLTGALLTIQLSASAMALGLCLAILCACSSQALYVADREPVLALRGFLAGVRRRFPPVEIPRDLGTDTQHLADAFGEAVLGRATDFSLP